MSLSQTEMDTLENEEFQRKSWLFQRWMWWLLGFFIAAAVAGFTSSAWTTRQRAEVPGGSADWPRFARQGASFELDVRLRSGDAFWVSHEFLDAFEIVAITPRPVRERAFADRVEFETVQATGGDARVRLWLKPVTSGFVTGALGFGADDQIHLDQFVYY
ncbi:MAG: hypothetical protein KF767_18535 [Bdellovibrionaceae bacterium]|nr:hypothetical protein [Pseudobdellovibrionaceae bacterium]